MASMPRMNSHPTAAFVLTLIGGILIFLSALAIATVLAAFGAFFLAFIPGLGGLLIGLSIAVVLFGVIIIVLAILMWTKPQSARVWGGLTVLLSLVSIFGGGGFLLGLILALIGGILALTWHPPTMTPAAWGPPPPTMGSAAPMPSAAPGGGRTCASCGSMNAAGATTCAKCGAPLTST